MLSFKAVLFPKRPASSWPLAAALFITVFAGLLRLDAFAGKYGTLDRPFWARVLTHDIAPLTRHLRPSTVRWNREASPYVGGDPFSYLKYAREMTTFYQPHVREPVFLATTRLGLWAVDNQDAGISLASAAGSVATVFATYLLGAALVSPLGGLTAAALMAIEYDAISWGVDGWRDDTFAALFVLTAWALIRFREAPGFGRALLLGAIAGAACLTRITALSFIVPAFAWIAIERRRSPADRYASLLVAMTIAAAMVVPFLVSCAIATGDPFFAINAHTRYYRVAEGVQTAQPIGTAAYLYQKIALRPVATLDIAGVGLFVRPFAEKWRLYDLWLPGLTTILPCAAVVGLSMWLFTSRGRFVLLILVSALLPYAFTWNVGDGGAWRFTMHVYSIYLVAAVGAFATGGRLVVRIARPARRPASWRADLLRAARRATLATAAAVVAIAVYQGMPWFVRREAIASGDAANILADGRDHVFYRSGWSRMRVDGPVNARVSQKPRAVIHFPLPQKRDYEIVLRLDPVAPGLQKRMTILFNQQLIGTPLFSWDPERIGSYRLSLPAAWALAGDNEITVIPDTMIAARSADQRFHWIDLDQPLGVRMWYLRVLD